MKRTPEVWSMEVGKDKVAFLSVGTLDCAFPELTAIETQIAKLLLSGSSYADIATVRQRSQKTIAHQVRSIYQKLDVSNRSELVALANSR